MLALKPPTAMDAVILSLEGGIDAVVTTSLRKHMNVLGYLLEEQAAN